MLDGFETLMRYITPTKSRPFSVPSIEVTPSRKLSIPNQLRFTRTCSDDSLDAIEKTCRKELRRQKMALETSGSPSTPRQETLSSLLPSPSMCSHMAEIGRSRTEPSSECSDETPTTTCKRSITEGSKDSGVVKKLAEMIGLSAYQQKLLVQTWPNIYSTGVGGQFASSIFSFLGSKNAKAKQIFAKANSVAVFANSDVDCSAMHSRATLDLLDTIVRNLDQDHSKMTAYIVELGKRHRSLRQEGLGITAWDDMGDALLESVRRFDAVRRHKELRRAWLSVFAYVTDNLKQGYSIRSVSSYDLRESSLDSTTSNSLLMQKKSVV